LGVLDKLGWFFTKYLAITTALSAAAGYAAHATSLGVEKEGPKAFVALGKKFNNEVPKLKIVTEGSNLEERVSDPSFFGGVKDFFYDVYVNTDCWAPTVTGTMHDVFGVLYAFGESANGRAGLGTALKAYTVAFVPEVFRFFYGDIKTFENLCGEIGLDVALIAGSMIAGAVTGLKKKDKDEVKIDVGGDGRGWWERKK